VASLNRARLARRLAGLTAVAGQAVRRRERLRDHARAGTLIRAALARAKIDPARVAALRLVAEAECELSRIGDSAELQRADAAFRTAEARPAAADELTAKAAARAADFAGRPPPASGASLVDWYAWSLAPANRPARQGDAARVATGRP
jgi:hypothetical protein